VFHVRIRQDILTTARSCRTARQARGHYWIEKGLDLLGWLGFTCNSPARYTPVCHVDARASRQGMCVGRDLTCSRGCSRRQGLLGLILACILFWLRDTWMRRLVCHWPLEEGSELFTCFTICCGWFAETFSTLESAWDGWTRGIDFLNRLKSYAEKVCKEIDCWIMPSSNLRLLTVLSFSRQS
jgi:hypothetical protein